MSEETDKIPEISFGVVGAAASPSSVEFADGVRRLPDHVIAELGGLDELEKLAPGLKTVTYDNFISSLRGVMESRQINRFQAEFVSRHFGQKLF